MMNIYLFLCVFIPCIVYEIALTKNARGGSYPPLDSDGNGRFTDGNGRPIDGYDRPINGNSRFADSKVRSIDGYGKLVNGKSNYVMRFLWLLIFFTYLYLLLSITGIGTIWDIGKYDSLIRMDEINLSPFSDILEEQSFDFLNIILFMSMGFLLPRIWTCMQSSLRVVLLGFLTSLMIELCQLLNYRATDINDLIYNTLGAVAGYLVWKFLHRRSVRKRKTIETGKAIETEKNQETRKTPRQTNSLSRSEPVMNVLISILGVFLLYNPRVTFPGNATERNDGKIVNKNTDTLPSPDQDSLEFEKDWVLDHANLFPPQKAKKAMDNPQLVHFMFLLGNGDMPGDTDQTLADSEITGKIPYSFQWDRRWGFEDYGDDNIGSSGCGPTCLSMVLAALKQDKNITPKLLADYAMEHDYYETGAGTRWSFMQDAADAFGVDAQTVYSSEILDKLSGGQPVIVSVGKGHFTDTGHFLVLAGLEDGKIRIHDPNSMQNTERLWDFDEFKAEIKSAWTYSDHRPQMIVTEHD